MPELSSQLLIEELNSCQVRRVELESRPRSVLLIFLVTYIKILLNPMEESSSRYGLPLTSTARTHQRAQSQPPPTNDRVILDSLTAQHEAEAGFLESLQSTPGSIPPSGIS